MVIGLLGIEQNSVCRFFPDKSVHTRANLTYIAEHYSVARRNVLTEDHVY